MLLQQLQPCSTGYATKLGKEEGTGEPVPFPRRKPDLATSGPVSAKT